jgi:hypothetical protein
MKSANPVFYRGLLTPAWRNGIAGGVTAHASDTKAIITTVYNPTAEEYAYINAVKRPGASLKYLILIPATQSTESTKSTPSTKVTEAIKARLTKTG